MIFVGRKLNYVGYVVSAIALLLLFATTNLYHDQMRELVVYFIEYSALLVLGLAIAFNKLHNRVLIVVACILFLLPLLQIILISVADFNTVMEKTYFYDAAIKIVISIGLLQLAYKVRVSRMVFLVTHTIALLSMILVFFSLRNETYVPFGLEEYTIIVRFLLYSVLPINLLFVIHEEIQRQENPLRSIG